MIDKPLQKGDKVKLMVDFNHCDRQGCVRTVSDINDKDGSFALKRKIKEIWYPKRYAVTLEIIMRVVK